MENTATRVAYGETLVELLGEGFDIYAVDADLSASTTSSKLAAVAPSRHINVGIAEQNMIGVAAGLSLAGKTVFTGSFAVFGTGRVYDQIRNTVCYANLNVKIAPTHAGISVGPDGGSHQMIEDLALMCVLPNMRVLVPADYVSAKAALRIAAKTPGPFYIRLGRVGVPHLYGEKDVFGLGKAKVVRTGKDVTIIACGIEVSRALNAAEMLAREGVEAEVIDVFSIKPLDEKLIQKSIKKTGFVVTAEEHSVIGGLASAISGLVARNPSYLIKPLVSIAVMDRFGTSGEIDELFREYGLDAQSIYENVIQCM